MVKYLVIRLNSIGDIVWSSAVVRCLKLNVEDAEVHFLTGNKFKEIVEHNPYIDHLHDADIPFKKLLKNLGNEGFDYVIDLQHNFKTHRIKNNLKVIDFNLNKLNVEKWILVNLKKNLLPQAHTLDHFMKTISLFAENDGKGLDLFIPENKKLSINQLPLTHQNGFIAVVLSAQYSTRQIPCDKLRQILQKISIPILLLGSDSEKDMAEGLASELGENVIQKCGSLSVLEMGSLIELSICVLTVDNEFVAIASALKKEVVVVWGSTVPAFGNYPFAAGEGSQNVEVADLKCRPCSKKGFAACPKNHFRCMNDIDDAFVAGVLNRLGEKMRF